MAFKPLNQGWTIFLPAADRAEMEKIVRSAAVPLSRLRDILQERLDQSERRETDLGEYDSPSWSAKQAHRNGARQELFKILDLFSHLDP